MNHAGNSVSLGFLFQFCAIIWSTYVMFKVTGTGGLSKTIHQDRQQFLALHFDAYRQDLHNPKPIIHGISISVKLVWTPTNMLLYRSSRMTSLSSNALHVSMRYLRCYLGATNESICETEGGTRTARRSC